MNQEAKFQLGLRERELMLHAEEKERGAQNAGQSAPAPVRESPQTTRAATTRELIVASLLEQAKSLVIEVNEEAVSQGTWFYETLLCCIGKSVWFY